MSVSAEQARVQASRSQAATQQYFPRATIKSDGPWVFRSQTARDVACLLDVDPTVSSWVCMPGALAIGTGTHIPDFGVSNRDGTSVFLDGPDRATQPDIATIRAAAAANNCGYRRLTRDEVHEGPRLKNAKDLLRYGDYSTPLGDRVRLLAALDEMGSLTFAECLQVLREGKPVAGLASMILREFIEVDLDEALIGPETVVRRIAR